MNTGNCSCRRDSKWTRSADTGLVSGPVESEARPSRFATPPEPSGLAPARDRETNGPCVPIFQRSGVAGMGASKS